MTGKAIKRDIFDRYCHEVGSLSKSASNAVERSIEGWYELRIQQQDPPTVAECREYAKQAMAGYVQVYDEAASSLAARWYDERAKESELHLEQAVTTNIWNPKSDDEVARYQAKKLAKLDKDGIGPFARACGEYAANDVMRSLNETIIKNVGRDADKGAKFARVPTGYETCTFCMMLASRGAVYHTRKSAGEFRHFHRGCDCKVVPAFGNDKYEEVVQGVRPKELLGQWECFKEIDKDESLTWKQRREIKMDILSGGSGELYTSESATEWGHAKLNKHAVEHAERLGVENPKSREGQIEYDSIMSDIIDKHDAMIITHCLSGQDGNRCAVFVRGHDIAVINLDTRMRVTAFRYGPGVSRVYDAIWDQIGT